MRFIQKWSYSCAKFLAAQLGDDHNKRNIYYYGFQIMIGTLVKGTILMAASILLGSLLTAIVVMLSFAIYRILAGGIHMDTYGKCLGVSMALFLIPAMLTQHTYKIWAPELVYGLIALSFITAVPVILKWAPADTPNKPITKPSQIKHLKAASMIFMVIWLCIALILEYIGLTQYALASCFGILIETFTVTPAGYDFFGRLSGKAKVIEL